VAHGDADSGQPTPRSTFYDTGRFGRLFPALPPFSADVPLIRDALSELGAVGGPMDAQDDLSDPVTLITDPAKSAHNPNNPTLTAGFTFLGQFLDHDMTFDPTSSLARAQDPESIRNFRIPALDLDSVYGGGPGVSPYLYDQSVDGGRTTFLTEEIPGSAAVSIDGNARRDLPRNSQSVALIADPRNDSAAADTFGLKTQLEGTLSASYAFSRLWYVEASVGYRSGTVGKVMAQAQFVGVPNITGQPFNFAIFNYDAGTISQVPVELTAGIRFRPKAAFNPYLCAGVGYTFVSFTPSDDLNHLSLNLDQSAGGFARLSGSGNGEQLESAAVVTNLTGIKVDVPDAPEWHIGGGFEYSIHSKWAIYLDARYYTYSGKFGMTINGANSGLGVAVPNDSIFLTDPANFQQFGAVQVTTGGLIDGGSFVPNDPAAPPGFCAAHNNLNCSFTGPPDGIPDLGMYYVQAGSVRYNGFSLQLGVKFTF
jgi:outer membrane protein W